MGPSVQQLLIVLVIVVLLFGAKKIPELAKGLGSGIKNFKKAVKEDEEATTTVDKVEAKPEEKVVVQNSTHTEEKKA
ncbi:MAG: twin-arginine translocase TatA/TatE family subunit [Sulfurospirillaceae bacterium]|nr:twin-arginine translocase TatA/TatE family subunit [Sulfurospirillaceae bacterium]MDD2827558.1 twin-arginine translocase TatA/TatE family subunit [Sulfurospirillaceae bacterium]